MSRDTIILGPVDAPIATFTGDDVGALSGHNAVDLIGDQLSVDTLDPSVWQRFVAPVVYKPQDYSGILTRDGYIYCCHFEGQDLVKAAPYGTPVFWQRDGAVRGRYYVKKIVRQMAPDGLDEWHIRAVSLIGLLDKQDHAGNVYTGQALATVAAEILGGTVSAVEGGYLVSNGPEDVFIEAGLGGMGIYGWLPYARRRANLHQLLFVSGGSLCRDNESNIQLRCLSMASPAQIEADRLFVDGSMEYDAAFTGVELVEHSFQWAYNAPSTSLFDNSDAYSAPAENTTIKFAAPVKPDSIYAEGGLVIHEAGTNYAVVSGKGVLKGVPYAHITRTIGKYLENSSLPSNVHPVTNVTLVNALNSENVLERIFRLHTQAFVHSVDVDIAGEKTGNAYSLKNVSESFTGILSNMELNSEELLRASCQFITGYTPGPFGNNYNNSALLTGSGSWIVPQSVRESAFPYIRITLVGAGGGGDGGEGGEQGRGTWNTMSPDGYGYTRYDGKGGGRGGRGGKGGNPGIPGKVLTIEKLDVSDIARIDYVCGFFGLGGGRGIGGTLDNVDRVAPTAGNRGGETTLKLYDDAGTLIREISTADGNILPSGVLDLVNDRVYALEGVKGTDGGDAGDGGTSAFGSWGGDGESVTHNGVEYPGGKGSASEYETVAGTEMIALCGGGSGAGAAAGTPGGDALSDGQAVCMAMCRGGDAGYGATPSIVPSQPSDYGQSGDGGHGGGGGGSGGAQNWKGPSGGFHEGIRDGLIGPGGDGTDGAHGADGCWFAYW